MSATVLIGPAAEAQLAAHPRVTSNARLGDDPEAVRGRDAPGLAVNPADDRHIVTVETDVLGGDCMHRVTFDGGASWERGTLSAPAGFPSPPCPSEGFQVARVANNVLDATVAFGSGGNVYTALSLRRGGEGESVLVARSTDGGRSFATAQVVLPGGPSFETADRYQLAKLAVDPRPEGDRVYVATYRARAQPRVDEMLTVTSLDGGRTWAAPVAASAPTARANREFSPPVVGPGGIVYLAWRSNEPPGSPNHQLVVGRSTDRGASWSSVPVVPVTVTNPNIASGTYPKLAVDGRSGRLYVAYQESPPGSATPSTRQDHFLQADSDIWVARSADGGSTWSGPVRVNDDPPGPVQQRLPRIAVAPGGRVDVAWHDRRHAYRAPRDTHSGANEARLGDTYYASSTDGGVTFTPNRRVTDRSINLDIGFDHRSGSYWYSAPFLVPVGDHEVLVAWQDSREGGVDNDNQDIYTARLNLRAEGPVPVQDLSGTGAAGLATAISRHAYPGGGEAVLADGAATRPATKVVLVHEDDVAAALVGAVLARANLGPVLVSPTATLPSAVRAEVARLAPVGAYVLGDEARLAPGVVDDLVAAGVPRNAVTRLGASSPAELAALVARAVDRRETAQVEAGAPAFDAAVVANPATGEGAGAAGMAAALRLPVLYVDRDSVPSATTDALQALGITRTYVLGGQASVSESVASRLPGPTRLAADGGQASSSAIVAESLRLGLATNIVYLADAAAPMDVALLGAAVGRAGGLLLSVPGADPGAAIASLTGHGRGAALDRIVVARAGPSGTGYRLAAADGGVFAFGDAGFHGSTGALSLSAPVVAMDATPSGRGYWLAASDGGVFAFGDAGFHGSTGALRLNRPVVGMAATPSGRGYWLVASDGGVFALGDAAFRGSAGALPLRRPVVGIASSPTGTGYRLVASDGGVFSFGDARFLGGASSMHLTLPVVAIASG